jgi:hypothetical protein
MTDEQLNAAAIALKAIETRTNEAIADWAFEYIVPFI